MYTKIIDRRLLAFMSALLLITGCNPDNRLSETDWPEVTAEAKPWTRWWWMGSDVDTAGLRYNLGEMARVGYGGVEVTPIYGVKGREANYVDYLSPEWMGLLGFTIEEAGRLGMKVDMNSGTGWPFGGPEITPQQAAAKAFHVVYHAKGGTVLEEHMEVPDYHDKQKNIAYLERVIAFSGVDRYDISDHVTDGVLRWSVPEGGDWEVHALYVGRTLQAVKRAAPGGEGLVMDHLDPQVVKDYFAKYEKAFSENGTPYPSSFFNDSYEVFGADWTPSLLAEFEKRRGYKLELYLPELYGKGQDEASVRVISDYRQTLSEILVDNFTKPWTEWAHSHGATTRNQGHGSPANLIDIYASVDIPECETFGISDFDIPGLRQDPIRKKNDGDPSVLKYASSAAHITGRKYTSAESLTWLTDHFRTSLSQMKVELDQMFTSGVNHVYFHGYTYSPEDVAWPGWKFYATIDFSPTNPIWYDAPALADYITRVQSFMQDGKPDNDFLLYLPIYDMWAESGKDIYMSFSIHGMRERLPDFCNAVDNIMKAGYDVDYVSDNYLAGAVVEDGFIKTEGGSRYKALILPAVTILPEATMVKVRELIERGGTVIFAGHYPSDVPGLKDFEERREMLAESLKGLPQGDFVRPEVNSVGKGRVITGSGYADMLAASGVRPEKFITEWKGQLIRRSHSSGHHYFMAMLTDNPVDGWVPLAVDAASAMIFDPMTGRSGKAKTRKADGGIDVFLQMKPGQSLIVKTFEGDVARVANWNYKGEAVAVSVLESGGWELSFPQSEPAVDATYKLEYPVSWTELGDEVLNVNMARGRYSLNADVEVNEGTVYVLSLGDVRESARVYINGEQAGILISPPFEVDITPFLKNGTNNIDIDVTNLPANRIADYDRRGVEWRIFRDINIVDLNYRPAMYGDRDVVESGLLGPVAIIEYK